MDKRKNACIICGQEKDGLEVMDDNVLRTMRWVKEHITGKKKNFRLVVCKEDFPAYRKLRAAYERRTTLYVGLGVIFTIGLAIVAGPRILAALLYGIFLIVLMYLLGQISYIPKVRVPETAKGKAMRG